MDDESDEIGDQVADLGQIASPSFMSLRIELLFGETKLADATGFLVEWNGAVYLITNRHNLRGRNNATEELLSKTGGIPNSVEVLHNSTKGLGHWERKREHLYNDQDPQWLEHPLLEGAVDVVALPLTDLVDVAVYPYDIWSVPIPIRVAPGEIVSVVGFPFSLTAGLNFAVWIQGAIASEPGLDWNNQPVFLVDSRTRSGSSGSPVIAYRPGTRLYEDGRTVSGPTEMRFLGVYSGRVSDDSDLGMVWKPTTVTAVLEGQHHPPKALDAPDF